jgi:hypothetical protein
MQVRGTGSWQFGHGTMGYLETALFVRDAAGLPVEPDPSVPPRLTGDVPDHSGVLAPGDRIAAARQWLSWWHRLTRQAAAEGQRAMVRRPPADTEHEFQDVIRFRFAGREDVFDPPEFRSLTGAQPLHLAVTSIWPFEGQWSRSRPGDREAQGSFGPPAIRDAAEGTAAELGIPVGSITGYAYVLSVAGHWSFLAGPGSALVSAGLARDPVAAGQLARDIFRSAAGHDPA